MPCEVAFSRTWLAGKQKHSASVHALEAMTTIAGRSTSCSTLFFPVTPMSEIERVARRLIEQGKLTGTQLNELLHAL